MCHSSRELVGTSYNVENFQHVDAAPELRNLVKRPMMNELAASKESPAFRTIHARRMGVNLGAKPFVINLD
ncbi:MAG: hypothetical protein M3Y72_24025 [Acidobacteriota bacterium]|nr:hypothetical protein [Acidobacteriota bacterium]